eukprot:11082_1
MTFTFKQFPDLFTQNFQSESITLFRFLCFGDVFLYSFSSPPNMEEQQNPLFLICFSCSFFYLSSSLFFFFFAKSLFVFTNNCYFLHGIVNFAYCSIDNFNASSFSSIVTFLCLPPPLLFLFDCNDSSSICSKKSLPQPFINSF